MTDQSAISNIAVLTATTSLVMVLFFLKIKTTTKRTKAAAAAFENGKQFVVQQPQSDADWSTALPGIPKEKMKSRELFREPSSGRFALELVIGPNEKYPSHLHGSCEWCFLTHGELSDQFGTKQAGDFFYNENASLHHSIRAGPEGCRILVVKDQGKNMPRPDLD